MTATAVHDVIQRHPLAFSSGVVLTVVGIELLLKTTHDLLSLDLAVITVGIISGALISLVRRGARGARRGARLAS